MISWLFFCSGAAKKAGREAGLASGYFDSAIPGDDVPAFDDALLMREPTTPGKSWQR
jgi:hypothetical protein